MSHTGTIYFFNGASDQAEHEVFSQFFALRFSAPLPTYESITNSTSSKANTTSTSSSQDSTSSTSPTQPSPMHTFLFAEQYMMYAKAMTFKDTATATEILKDNTPRKCKGLGRKVEGFSDEVWDRYKEAVVEEGNWWKFTNGEGKGGRRARETILDTGDKELVEASPFDRIWGIGFRAADAERNRGRWGTNLLGKAIMRVRERMKDDVEREGDGGETSGV